MRASQHIHLLLILSVSLAVGCGSNATTGSGENADTGKNQKMTDDLKKIGIAFHAYMDANNYKSPSKAADLGKYLENDKRLLDLLEKEEIVFSYGINMAVVANSTGFSNTILAYEKDAPTKGGAVLMCDDTVKKMSAEEFKKADLPKPMK